MPANAGLHELGSQLSGQLFRGQRNQPRTPANGLRKGFVQVAPSSQRGHRVALWKLFNDGKCALADRAGGTENG